MCQYHGEPKATTETGTYKAVGKGECLRPEGHQHPWREGTEEGFTEEVVPELTSRTS